MPRYTAEQAHQRRAEVIAMRRRNMTFDGIGQALGVSAQRAHQLYRQALDMMPVQGVDEHRRESLDLIDEATRELRVIATAPRTSARSRIEAWRAMATWAERRARLLGLDAPTRRSVEILTTDVMTQAIAQLEAEISAADAVERALGLVEALDGDT